MRLNKATLAMVLCAGASCLAATGCSWFAREPEDPFAATERAGADGVVQAGYSESGRQVVTPERQRPEPTGWERFSGENLKKTFKKAIGKGPNESIARQRYDEGEQLFGQQQYDEAAKKFAEAADRWPDSSLEENAMFMQAESLFFSDKYSKACDLYGELMKKYVNTAHLDTCVRRQFAIADYWVKFDQANPRWPIVPNLDDRTLPWFDPQGNAMKALDDVRINDPRGPLADDAIMAAANAFFVRGRWSDADYYYGLLRTDYPRSEFQVQAHLLGLQCKMKIYQGPDYDGKALVEAEDLIDQMLFQFPTELGEERQRLLTAKAEVRAQRAYREWHAAQFYEKGDYYGGARYHYNVLVQEYPGTQFAKQAEARLAEIGPQPDNPPDRFAFLDYVFGPPSGKAAVRR
jgi:outer membrane protein assembly factor BamD (BamD/ComL family)